MKPKLIEFEQRQVIFGLDKDDPFFSKKNVNAAWTLQRAFRVFRAKKMASRRRYELWLRSAARQWSLMNHLAESNTITMQAHNAAGFLGVRPAKPVFYDEIRHPFQPPRLSSTVNKEAENIAIKREFDYKYRDRIAYLQKCAIMQGREYFAVGKHRRCTNVTWWLLVCILMLVVFGFLLCCCRLRENDIWPQSGSVLEPGLRAGVQEEGARHSRRAGCEGRARVGAAAEPSNRHGQVPLRSVPGVAARSVL